jgi:restriction system protein
MIVFRLMALIILWPVRFLVISFKKIICFLFLSNRVNKKKLIKRELNKIDKMRGVDFEKYSAKLFKALGYKNIKLTVASGDYGADIIMSKHNKKYVVQCKRYSSSLGVKSIQEVISARIYYSADYAIVITNSCFTRQANLLAQKANIILYNRQELIKILSRVI